MIYSLLKIERGEGDKVVHFVALAALLQAGLAIGMGTADSLFLHYAGPERLPVIYLLLPVMMLGYLPFSAYLTSKMGSARLLRLVMFVMIAGGAALAGLLLMLDPAARPVWIYYVAKLYAALWFVAQYFQYWNFTDDYFDVLDAKRLFPLFSSGAAVGAITGGSVLNVLAEHVPTAALFAIWSLFTLAAVPVAFAIQRRFKEAVLEPDPDKELGLRDVLGRIRAGAVKSPYVRLFVIVAFAAYFASAICEYQYMTIFSGGRSEAELTQLFGRLYIVVNAFSLVVGLFLFNRLVLRIGVPNMALVQPVAYLLAFAFLVIAPGFEAAAFAFFAYQGLMPAIMYDAQTLLLNAVPSDIKAGVRTFVDGLAEPTAVASVGMLLLLFGATAGPQYISLAGFVTAALYTLCVFLIRSGYISAMVENLRRGWIDLANPPEHLLRGLPPSDIELLQRAALSTDRDEAQRAIRILWLNDRQAAAERLTEFLGRAHDDDRDAARGLLAMMLDSNDADVVKRIVEWAQAHAPGELGTAMVAELGARGLVQSEDLDLLAQSEAPEDRAAAAVGFLNSWKFEEGVKGAQMIRELLSSPEGTKPAIRAIGYSRQARYAYALGPFIRHPAGDVRREAVRSVRRLAARETHRLLPDLVETIRVGSPDERAEGFEAIARIGDPRAVPSLLRLADRFTPFERRRAETLLVRLGLQSVPVVVSVLRDRTVPFAGRYIAGRALGRLNLAQLEFLSTTLIQEETAHAYRGVWRWSMLEAAGAAGPGIDTLKRYYLDVRSEAVDFLLQILTVTGRLPNFELLANSLASSNPKEHANAIETIEQGVDRQTFRALLPLIDNWPVQEQAEFFQRRDGAQPLTLMDVLVGAIQGTWLERLIAAQALADSGADGVRVLRDHLERLEPEIAREVFDAVTRRDDAEAGLTQVEKIHTLIRSPLFDGSRVQEAHAVAEVAVAARFADGEYIYRKADAADAAYCVVDGEVTLLSEEGAVIRRPNEIFGDAGLRGEFLRTADAVSGGGRVLTLRYSPLIFAARNNVRIATALFGRTAEPMRQAS